MEIYDLGKEPISVDNPAGSDISHDEDYGELVDEIKKLSSPTAGSAIDWTKVTELCTEILGQESKNILVACYFTVALGHTKGLKGCATGIHVLRELLDNFWDTLYPSRKRKKGRINALSWLNERLKELLEPMECETWEQNQRTEVIDDLTAIETFISENLPDGPILRPLIELLADRIVEPGPLETESQPDATEPEKRIPLQTVALSSSSPLVTSPVTTAPPVDSNNGATDADDFFRSGLDFLGQSASRLFAKDHTRPSSYQLNRLVAWSQIESLPPAKDGKTMLPPPDEQLQSLLVSQYQTKEWPELLSTAEGHVRQYLFWLDLSYWVATALEQIQANEAAMAVTNDTLLYTKCLQSIETLCFEDGTPFAGEETREWLFAACNQPVDPPVKGVVIPEDTIDKYQEEAMHILSDKGLTQAIHYFQEQSGSGSNDRERFRHDIALSQISLKAKKPHLALPFIERILQTIDSVRLENWEPELALQAMLISYKCLKLIDKKEHEKQIESLLKRIILLDPEKSINIV